MKYFIADEATVGTVVQVGKNTSDERQADAEFRRYLFQYFEQLTSGQTGWGVDFIGWLEMTKGWKHHGCLKFERVLSIADAMDWEEELL